MDFKKIILNQGYDFYIKQLLDEVFVISIKVKVKVGIINQR